jgi:hypothetical protein
MRSTSWERVRFFVRLELGPGPRSEIRRGKYKQNWQSMILLWLVQNQRQPIRGSTVTRLGVDWYRIYQVWHTDFPVWIRDTQTLSVLFVLLWTLYFHKHPRLSLVPSSSLDGETTNCPSESSQVACPGRACVDVVRCCCIPLLVSSFKPLLYVLESSPISGNLVL